MIKGIGVCTSRGRSCSSVDSGSAPRHSLFSLSLRSLQASPVFLLSLSPHPSRLLPAALSARPPFRGRRASSSPRPAPFLPPLRRAAAAASSGARIRALEAAAPRLPSVGRPPPPPRAGSGPPQAGSAPWRLDPGRVGSPVSVAAASLKLLGFVAFSIRLPRWLYLEPAGGHKMWVDRRFYTRNDRDESIIYLHPLFCSRNYLVEGLILLNRRKPAHLFSMDSTIKDFASPLGITFSKGFSTSFLLLRRETTTESQAPNLSRDKNNVA